MASGVVVKIALRHIIQSAAGGSGFYYWHVVPLPTMHHGTRVRRGQLIGHVAAGYYHVNVVESERGCGWVNPMRPGGSLHVSANTEPASIGALHAYAADRAAFRSFPTNTRPSGLVDPARPEQLAALYGHVDLRAAVFDSPVVRMVARRQLPLEPAAIRVWLAPLGRPRWHVSPIKLIYQGAQYFRPARLGTTRWRVWAFGTWRMSKGYFETGPQAKLDVGADYVWHVGGMSGFDTLHYPDGRYLYCVQALTINAASHTRCTPVTIANHSYRRPPGSAPG